MRRPLPGLILFLLLALPHVLLAYDRYAWTSYPDMNDVTALAEGNNQIFVATTGGIRRYDQFRKRWLAPLTVLDGLPDNHVERIVYDPSTQDLWLDTPAGAAVWMSGLEMVSLAAGDPPVPPHPPISIPRQVFMPFGYSLGNGVIRGPRQTYPITDALIDTWHDLWIGTRGLGVGMADTRDWQLRFYRYGPIDENVTAIARDGDAIWFGGADLYAFGARGITRFRPKTDTWDYFEPDRIFGLNDVGISAILPDSAEVWFGTRRGLVRYTRHSEQWHTYPVFPNDWGRVTALARDGGRLWIGTDEGLAVFDLKADSIRVVGGSERFLIHALAAGPDYVWAGTNLGLYRCPRGGVTWKPAPGPPGLVRGNISAVTLAGKDVWATVDAPGALIHLSPDSTVWKRYPISEVSGSPRVGLAADAGRVWIATDQGAFRFDVESKLWKRYTRSDGLLQDCVQAVLLEGNDVWFGTTGGVSRFNWARDFFEKTH